MDATILLRLGPALLVAWGVAQASARPHAVAARDVTDELLRVLVVGLVVGRLAFMVLEPAALGATLSIAVLVRAGVETGFAALVTAGLLVVDARRHDAASWLAAAAVPSALAGSAAWNALCQVQGVCAGNPVAWGVQFPGRAFPAFPSAYVESALFAGLAGLAWRWRAATPRLLGVAAAGAIARAAMGFTRPVLGGHPSRDQGWFLLLAVVLAFLAVVARRQGDPVEAEAGVADGAHVPADPAAAGDGDGDGARRD